jgi:hypothetical protein
VRDLGEGWEGRLSISWLMEWWEGRRLGSGAGGGRGISSEEGG